MKTLILKSFSFDKLIYKLSKKIPDGWKTLGNIPERNWIGKWVLKIYKK